MLVFQNYLAPKKSLDPSINVSFINILETLDLFRVHEGPWFIAVVSVEAGNHKVIQKSLKRRHFL